MLRASDIASSFGVAKSEVAVARQVTAKSIIERQLQLVKKWCGIARERTDYLGCHVNIGFDESKVKVTLPLELDFDSQALATAWHTMVQCRRFF